MRDPIENTNGGYFRLVGRKSKGKAGPVLFLHGRHRHEKQGGTITYTRTHAHTHAQTRESRATGFLLVVCVSDSGRNYGDVRKKREKNVVATTTILSRRRDRGRGGGESSGRV